MKFHTHEINRYRLFKGLYCYSEKSGYLLPVTADTHHTRNYVRLKIYDKQLPLSTDIEDNL